VFISELVMGMEWGGKDGVVIVEMFHIVARPYEVKGDGVK
jgi:hypothetical protein